MSRLTKKQRNELGAVLESLRRADQYLRGPNVAVCRKGGAATTTLHYTRADGSVMFEVDKEIGSDLTGLGMGLDKLSLFLSETATEAKS